jgi:hypothetical protein
MRKKKNKIAGIALLTLISIFTLILIADSDIRFVIRETFFPTSIMSYKRSSVEDFAAYKEDYIAFKDFCMKYHNTLKRKEKNYLIINYFDGGRSMSNAQEQLVVALSNSEQNNLMDINESFGDDFLKLIYFNENNITFKGEDDFAIVFSFNDKKPNFLMPGEDVEKYYYYIHKLGDHWYTITRSTKS